MTSATSAFGYSHGILYTLEHDATNTTNKNNNNNNNATTNSNSRYKNSNSNNNNNSSNDNNAIAKDDAVDDNVEDNDKNNNNKNNNNNDDDETDSFASMETLSDNVAIWVEGEQHWISGVDANTTCADLIDALVNYQESEQPQQQQQQQQLCGITNNDTKKSNNNCNNNSNSNNNNNQSINKSTLNTKEKETAATTQQQQNQNSIEQQHSRSCGPATATTTATTTTTTTATTSFPAHSLLSPQSSPAPPPPPPPQPCNKKDHHDVMYVIVKQHRHYEEFLDGNAKVFDVLPPSARDVPGNRKELHHQLYLRRLTHTTQHISRNTPQLSSLLSTDKDSGMGSPVGSSRSAKFRRKKHKSYITNWLSQGNTLHPKSSQHGSAANERLLKIILAQDETIHRQLTLLREKERQITKIEEEKHRKRERELGKNYLLETYLNDLDEYNTADGLDMDEGEEIFIDEEFQGYTTTAAITANEMPTKQKQHKQRKKHGNSKHSKTFKNDNLITKEKPKPNAADTTHSPADVVGENNPKDIESQILWLEKIYAINKKLQNEEELLLKLHSKIRKYQVKRVYHTKQQLVQQMDEVDNNIALQYHDIRKVENSLVASNEQLKSKLVTLEKLSQELLNDNSPAVDGDVVEVGVSDRNKYKQHSAAHIAITKAIVHHNDLHIVGQKFGEDEEEITMEQTSIANAKSTTIAPTTNMIVRTAAAAATSTEAPPPAAPLREQTATAPTPVAPIKLAFNKMQSPTDLLSLQKLIAKPQAFHLPVAAATATSPLLAAATTTAHKVSSTLNVATNFPISLINHPTKSSCVAELQIQQQQQQQHHQQQQLQLQLLDHQQQLNDKNSLALHVNQIKTIKKQMFGPKCITVQELKPPPSAAAAIALTANTTTTTSLDFTQLGTLV